jgi:hypothetical protein
MKASRTDVDTLFLEVTGYYGKPLNEQTATVWRDVLAENFSEGEIRAALNEHQADTSRDYKGNLRGEAMPTAAAIKFRIETKRAAIAKKRFYCGDADCFGIWRAAGPNTRDVIRCEKCEALRESDVAPYRGETLAEHIKTPEYAKARADMEAALRRVFGRAKSQVKAIPREPSQVSLNDRAMKLREQARELAARTADFPIVVENLDAEPVEIAEEEIPW